MAPDLDSVARTSHRARAPAALLTVVTGAILYGGPSIYAQCGYDIAIGAGPDCGPSLSSPTLGRGISEVGEVVGNYTVCGIGTGEAFYWDGGPDLVTLERPKGVGGAGAWDINDAGLIIGAMAVTGMGDRAFFHNGTQFIDLGTPPTGTFSRGRGINNLGDGVGNWGNTAGDPALAAFLWRDGAMIDLMPDLGTPAGEALDVNDAGQVVGWMGLSLVKGGEAFVWQDGQVTALGQIPGGSFSAGEAINEPGEVAGWAFLGVFPDISTRAFLWRNGRMMNLGTLEGFERSAALDINDLGQIAGRAWGVDGNPNVEAAFIWQDGIMTDLNDLIPPNAGVEITWATAINNQGQITGQGDADNGDVVAVLLTPVEPPLGDLDGDCRVGTADLLELLATWGPCPKPCPPFCLGDLDGNCLVSTSDLLILLGNWG